MPIPRVTLSIVWSSGNLDKDVLQTCSLVVLELNLPQPPFESRLLGSLLVKDDSEAPSGSSHRKLTGRNAQLAVYPQRVFLATDGVEEIVEKLLFMCWMLLVPLRSIQQGFLHV